MTKITFSILISTKNRKDDLGFTLQKIKYLLDREDVTCVVFDDGSTDGTTEFIKENFPQIILHTNKISKGYLYCRNKMLNETTADFAISLDDDAHFVTEKPLELIEDYFAKNEKAGVLGFRVFWSKLSPISAYTNEETVRMKSFVGCAHVWRMQAWQEIPNYPEWFVFYGEEDFASYQLFKKNWEVDYLPEVLVNHRVDVSGRKKNKDYSTRLRRSLRAGWYLYFLFYPLDEIPKRFLYTLWIQFKTKVFKGDFKALYAILRALLDLIYNLVRLVKQSNRLTRTEFDEFMKLSDTKLYWRPEHEKICN
ncbi:glycosyltransferase family 2 protein [Flavobacterium sp. KACC 22761]|uniref:glycosyltransferase family 2 protein n=1 Tax=Flavobacterium sp. KACC 22761 TaxID=3092665 RepID=UPI002A7533DF|nr:glycosyltransferase [Flavobacterium sp. KACC 22761]WPO79492.1 glycosyltransferase [Flavobacterium sp. KACC 22761]